MTPDLIGNWIGAVLGAIALATVIYNWFTSGEKSVAADLAASKVSQAAALAEFKVSQALEVGKLRDAIDVHDSRIQQLENEMKHLPDRDQTHRLELAVQKLTGQMETLDERLKPVAAISNRLQEFLIDQAATVGRK